MDAVHRFDNSLFNTATIREFALKFDTQVFKHKLGAFIHDKVIR